MIDFDFVLMERRQLAFDGSAALCTCRFQADQGCVPSLNHAKRYAEAWSKMKEKGLGMLFWGPPGTGKTFAAACIANAFIESKDPFAPTVIMTTFGIILRRVLACTPQEREDYLNRLLGCNLLILDDFGMERQTEFAREQVFNLVNGRYLAQKPMVITTNLALQDMKHPKTMDERRIFDRVLEVCVPVCFDGESLRKQKASENLRFYRELLGENAGCA